MDTIDPPRDLGTRAVRNYAVAALRVILGQVLAAATFLVLSHELRPADYALYAGFAIVPPAAYYMITRPFTWVLVRREAAPSAGELRAVATFVTVTAVSAALVWSVFVAGSSGPLYLAAATVVYGAILSLSFPSFVLLSRELRPARASFIELLERAGFQLVTVAGVLTGIALDWTLALGIVAGGFSALVFAQFSRPWAPGFASPGRALGVRREASAPAAALALALLVDMSLIPLAALLSTSTEAGLLGWAFSIYLIPMAFINMAGDVLLPTFARVEKAAEHEVLSRSIRTLAIFGMLLATCAAAALPAFVEVALPDRWEAALPAAWLLLAAAAVNSCSHMAGTWWNARASMAQYARWQGAATAATLVLMVPLATREGAAGAAGALLAGRLLMAGLLLRGAARQFGVRVGTFVVVGCAAMAASSYVGWLVHSQVDSAVAVAAAPLLAAVTLAALLGAWRVTREDLAVTARLLAGRS